MKFPLNRTPDYALNCYAPPSRHMGGTGVGFLAGLLVGLVIALVVAFYVTNAPLPFANKGSKLGEKFLPKAGSELPDPNRPLYGKDVKEGRIPAEETSSNAVLVAPSPATSPAALGVPDAVPASSPPPTLPFYLQTGSFKSIEDAEQLRARLALAGVEANLSQAEVDGKQVNRVRVGPFSNAEEAYKARAKLTENGFEARLVKPIAIAQ
jgi:cell division protein FtsN